MKIQKQKPKAGQNEVRRLQHALDESEARRQTLLASTLDCIISADSQAKITDFNTAAERTFRVSRAAVLGKDLADTILPPDSRAEYRRELFSTAISHAVEVIGRRLEAKAMRSDGAEFFAEFTVSRVVIRKKITFIVHVRDITARKRAEEAVVWLAAIVESSQDAIYGGGLDGRLTNWNKGAEIMFGYTASEALGQHVSFLIPAEAPNELAEIRQKMETGFGVRNFETLRLTKDGRRLDVSLSISPVMEAGTKVVGVSVIARDISARKAAEEALRKANETSVYASPIPIIAVDAGGCVTRWNVAAEFAFGWTEAEVLGKPDPLVLGNDADETANLYKQLFAGKTLTGVEVRRQRKDKSLATISLSATPLWDENHKIKGILKFLTDITEQKLAEEVLRKTEENYRSIFENSLEGIYQTTPEGEYLAANPALARMMGFDSPAELTRERTDLQTQEYVSSELHTEFIHLMEERGFVKNFEYQAYRKDGKTIWVSANARVVRNAQGKTLYYEGTLQDITRRRELEGQLRQMQKIEAIGRLAGGVAHDFNNILMAISSFGELLHKKLPAGDSAQKYLDEIVKATDRGASLTQSLLAFSRKQVLSPKVIDLNDLIAMQIGMLKRLITEDIDLKFAPNTDLGRVRVDPSQIEQVVMNLVINARDAMIGGGEIVIETDHVEVARNDLTSQDPVNAGKYVVLTITDNGCGMDAETQSHIFEPFFTTKQQGKGTGLGLATVFGIVKQSSGYIYVNSKPGHGTTFNIYLPRVEEAVEPLHKETCEIPVRGDETILLVEDEEAVRRSAAEYLVENGYNVLVASHGSEALELAEQHAGTIHLMLTDLIMPKMSGRELAERLKVVHPETQVVFMSGYSNNLLSSQQILDPTRVLLQKPFRLGALGACIREALSSKSAATSAGQ